MSTAITSRSPVTGPEPAVWSTAPDQSAPDGPLTERGRWRRHLPLSALLVGTALLYLVGLSKSGWANQYYAAAAQAGSQSWKAFLFGSLDASNFLTVDKPPASLWVMDISVKVFGLNSWSVLVPQALEGVAAVALLYAAVSRVSTRTAGLLAGAALALTPVATLMFRYDNPDALLVLLMTAAAYATVRALEHASARWLALTGALIGFAFLTKMLQGLLVVPAFAIVYLVAAPTTVRRRVLHVLGSGLAMVVAAGWWVALVELWPSGSRPYIGGSTNNSILELMFGYNGVGRLTGSDNNGSVGGTGGTGFSSGSTGLGRLFGSEMGSQIAWLLPLAIGAIGALVRLTWTSPRTDRLRASTIMWGTWLLVTGLVFSFASGIIHAYYTVALAPAIAALTGLGVAGLWRVRDTQVGRWTLAGLIAVTALWTNELLGRADWHGELRWIVVVAGIAAAGLILAGQRVRAWILAPLIALTLLLAPAAYSLQTASSAHAGALPTAGPSSGFGGFGGGGPGRTGAGMAGNGPAGGPPSRGTQTNQGANANQGGFPGGTGGQRGTGGTGGGMGGLGGATTVSSALSSALQKNADDYTWVAATVSDNQTSSLELATGESVMSLGGYNGTDPVITLAQFKQLVSEGKIHYFVADQQGFIGSTAANTSTAYAIQQWVTSHYTAKTVGSSTVYDLSS